MPGEVRETLADGLVDGGSKDLTAHPRSDRLRSGKVGKPPRTRMDEFAMQPTTRTSASWLRSSAPGVAVAAALLLPLAVSAQDPQSGTTAKTIRREVGVGGNTVNAAVDAVRSSLKWHSQLGPALRSARVNGKPLLWIQALGELDGFL